MNGTILLCAAGLCGAALLVILLLWLVWGHTKPDTPTKVSYTTPNFCDKAGFIITSLPTDDIFTLRQCWLLNGKVAQLDYEVDPNRIAQLRAARSGQPLTFPGETFQTDFDSRQVTNVDGIRVSVQQNPGREALAKWSKNSFDYLLYYEETEMGQLGGTFDDFVRETDSRIC